MVRYVRDTNAKYFIIGTEIGLLHRIKKENPDKIAIPAYEKAVCVNMKKITLEKIYTSLRDRVHVVRIPEHVAEKVLKVLERSYELLGVEIPWKKR